jgi:hypothetical protein
MIRGLRAAGLDWAIPACRYKTAARNNTKAFFPFMMAELGQNE